MFSHVLSQPIQSSRYCKRDLLLELFFELKRIGNKKAASKLETASTQMVLTTFIRVLITAQCTQHFQWQNFLFAENKSINGFDLAI